MEVFGSHGLPMSLYTDRGAHYFTRRRRAAQLIARDDAGRRALERLGVEHIAAYSPQARGRSERVFTPAGSTGQELALKEIDTVEAANLFLRDVYIPEYNARFAVAAAQEGTAFVAILASTLRRFYASRRSVRSAR